MAKVISPSSGALFLGTLSPESRTYLLRLFYHARQAGYARFVEPACGAFAMAHLAVQAGYRPEQIEASDVSSFSTVMGYAIMGRRLDDLEFELRDAPELYPFDLDLNDPGTVLWLIQYLRLKTRSENPVTDAARKEALLNCEAQIGSLQEQMEWARGVLGGLSYRPLDLMEHMEEVWDDQHTLICVNPPTYTGGFERYYDMGGHLVWNEPHYKIFDAELGVHDLMVRAMDSEALTICYQERPAGDALGQAIYVEDGIRRTRLDDIWNMYLCTNRFDEALKYAGGFGMKRKILARVEPGDYAIIPADYEPIEGSFLTWQIVPGPQSLYYRSIWTHKFGLDGGGNIGDGIGIFVDGYLCGVFGYDQSFVVGWKGGTDIVGRLMLHYGMAVPNRKYRYNRLLTMVAMHRDVFTPLLPAFYVARVREIGTVQQTRHMESKEMRGLMKLEKRKPHPRYGYKLVYVGEPDEGPFEDILPRWLKREQHWLAARESGGTQLPKKKRRRRRKK